MANNAAEMNLIDGIRILILSLVFSILIYFIAILIIRDPIKSALLTTLVLFLFFSYGHVNSLARSLIIADQTVGRHRILMPVYILAFVAAVWLIIRTKKDLSGLARILNISAIILLLLPVFQISSYSVRDFLAKSHQQKLHQLENTLNTSSDLPRHDVYYILLDGYPRNDFIHQYFSSDNSEFLAGLESKGFFVATCSQSNYTDTRFSMASTLNMEYLNGGTGLSEVVYPGTVLDNMIYANAVQQLFSDLGYTVVTFESGYKWLQWQDSDIHLKPANNSKQFAFLNEGLNDFELLLLETTAAKFFFDVPTLIRTIQDSNLDDFINNPRKTHRDRVQYALTQLPGIPGTIPRPLFVYAHIVFPHPPFILDADGNILNNSPPDEMAAYSDQVTYLNKVLSDIIDSLISNSAPNPIIILQSDHGATIDYEGKGIDKANRLGILNAFYLPDDSPSLIAEGNNKTGEGQNSQPYSTITPVNTFRIIFNRYFGGDYELLEDKSIVGRQSPLTRIECLTPSR